MGDARYADVYGKGGATGWEVRIYSYGRLRPRPIELHGYRVTVRGMVIAKRTGFLTFADAEAALQQLSLVTGEYNRQRMRRQFRDGRR